jgi:hypothetical protein
MLTQVALAAEPALEGNFCDRKLSVFQELFCPLDTLLQQILMGRNSS